MGKTGLIVEGGGMKCAYSAGILDRFLDDKITFDYCIGVSAGAANTLSYLAGQRGRNLRFYTVHLDDPRYLSVRSLLRTGNLFGLEYIYGTLTNSDGVLLENIREITASFNYQRELNPKIKQPVGHIALSFKPEDKALLTDEFMAKIAREYMELMGIRNTQFILVRHHNTDNPHCHLVYNRIGYDGKVISSQGDYKRNEIATKLLKDRYGLTYAEDKGKTNVEKLHASERVKYEIFNAVKAALKHSGTWKEFNDYLLRRGIRLEFVKRTREIKRPEDIQGIRFTKDGQTFKASQISREFSFARLNARLGWKTSESQQESERKVQQRIPDGGHLLESTGPGLFSPTSGTAPEEPLSQEALLRRRRKKRQKRKGFGL